MKKFLRGSLSRFLFLFVSLLFHVTGINAQDTLNCNERIVSSKGKLVKIKYKSEITGTKQSFELKSGLWTFTDEFDELVKTEEYKIDEYGQTSILHGDVTYYLDGSPFFIIKYQKGRLTDFQAFGTGAVIDGRKLYSITRQMDAFTIVEYDTNDINSTRNLTIATGNIASVKNYEQLEKKLGDENLLMEQSFSAGHTNNYITNPMIEDYGKIKSSFNNIGEFIPGWSVAQPSPDFHLTKDAFSGKACLGLRTLAITKDIEYLRNELMEPLKKDSFYCFSMKLLLSSYSGFATRDFSVLFAKDKEWIRKDLMFEPQLKFNTSYLIYKSRWMTLQCVYRAKGGEKYITLGTFQSLDSIRPLKVQGYSPEAYYYLDDISLVPIQNPDECPCTAKGTDIKIEEKNEPSPGDIMVLNGVLFENDKDILLPESKDTLDKLVQLLRKYPEMKIEIRGHTSSVGNYDHNMDLSDRRSVSVFKYLVSEGIDSNRLSTKGFGPNLPIAPNDTEEGQALNRRVEIRIVSI
ncbi:MAG: OmpA family protein [Bacteroidetes bacterium]|nr:OmpA family protein [Bacteroidota bacterium]